MSDGFAAKDYWERRLRDHFSLEGVGYLRLGQRFNEWMYRVRGDVFDRIVADHGLGTPGQQVLDVGPGTGFYVARWQNRGATVTGVDLAPVVASTLATRFPTARFLQADIGMPLAPPLSDETGRFDVVSAFDVLFHIVEDALYARALANISSLLKPGGVFIWSDNFIHRPTTRIAHQVSRSLEDITSAVDRAGFTIEARVPMFMLMNYPADAGRLAGLAWTALMSPAMVSNALGGLLGQLLYPIERRLVRSAQESPSTELMICRRR